MSASCARDNDTPLQCNNGCCGTTADQKCCSGFELSETVLIVCCVVGALIVFTAVLLLVLCITKKKKNAVTRIQPRRQRHHYDGERRRRPMVEMPKPPPYSEAPPEYNSWNEISRETPTVPSRSVTEYDHVTPSSSNQARNNRTDYEPAAPSRSSHVRNNRTSPHPSTSVSRALTNISNNRIHSQSDVIVETSNIDEISRDYNHSRNQVNSRTHRTEEDYRNVARNRPIATSSHDESGRVNRPSIHRSAVHEQITSTRPTNTHAHAETTRHSVDLPGEITVSPDSPPPINQAAALRSAKRRAVIMQLQSRRRGSSGTSSSNEE